MISFFNKRKFTVTYLLNGTLFSETVSRVDEPDTETARDLISRKIGETPSRITIISINPA